MKTPKPMVRELDAYLPLVQSTAWRLKRLHGLPRQIHEDLVQEGFIGLLDAHTRYDPGREFTFGTYARPRIEGAMLDYLHRESRVVYWPLDDEHHHAQHPVENAVAARESLSLISSAVEALSYRRRKIMKAVVNFESLEDAAEDVAVGYRKALKWRLEGLEELRILAA